MIPSAEADAHRSSLQGREAPSERPGLSSSPERQKDEPHGVAGRRVQVASGHVVGLAVGEPAPLALPDVKKRSGGNLGYRLGE